MLGSTGAPRSRAPDVAELLLNCSNYRCHAAWMLDVVGMWHVVKITVVVVVVVVVGWMSDRSRLVVVVVVVVVVAGWWLVAGCRWRLRRIKLLLLLL